MDPSSYPNHHSTFSDAYADDASATHGEYSNPPSVIAPSHRSSSRTRSHPPHGNPYLSGASVPGSAASSVVSVPPPPPASVAAPPSQRSSHRHRAQAGAGASSRPASTILDGPYPESSSSQLDLFVGDMGVSRKGGSSTPSMAGGSHYQNASASMRRTAQHPSGGNHAPSVMAASVHSHHPSQRPQHETERERRGGSFSTHGTAQARRATTRPSSAHAYPAPPQSSASHNRPLPSTYVASAGSLSMGGLGGGGRGHEGGQMSGPPSTIGEDSGSGVSAAQTAATEGRRGRKEVEGVTAVAEQLQAQVAALGQQLQLLYSGPPPQPQPQLHADALPVSPSLLYAAPQPSSPSPSPPPAPHTFGAQPMGSPEAYDPYGHAANQGGVPATPMLPLNPMAHSTATGANGYGPPPPRMPWSSPPMRRPDFQAPAGAVSLPAKGTMVKFSGLQSMDGEGEFREERRGAVSPEKARLRKMVEDLRVDRQRLEDRLCSDDPKSDKQQRQARDELEKQVLELVQQRDGLEAEAQRMLAMQEAALSARHEADMLRTSLWEEQQRNQQLQAAGGKMAEQLAGLSASLSHLTADHKQAVSSLTHKNESLAAHYKKAQQQLKEALATTERAGLMIKDLKREVESKSIAHSQAKAAAEVMRNMNQQLQSQLDSSSRELQGRCASTSQQLNEMTKKAEEAKEGQAAARKELEDARAEVKELGARVDYLRSEREKLLKLLSGEQAATAAAKQSLESLATRVRATEHTHSEAEASLRAQMHAMAEEHNEHVARLKEQYEAQLSVTDQEAQACLRRADSTQASSSKLVEVHNALRRERDELWSRCEELRSSLSAALSERDDLLSKVSMLRSEAKAMVADLKKDRDMRLQNEQLQHQALVSELKMQHERAAIAMGESHEHQMAGVLALADRLKAEVVEAQHVAEKHRSTINSLKDQIKEVLVVRDVMEQELASERQYNAELSQIVAQVKGSFPGRDATAPLPLPRAGHGTH